MPVGPSYREGSSPSSFMSDSSVAAAVTGAGRVCGTSARSEPNVTTRSTPRSCARPITSCENVFQRRFGSVPRRITASRPAPGISA